RSCVPRRRRPFGMLSGSSASNQGRIAWRLAAWAASAVVYGAHIAYEHFRLRNSPHSTALHAAVAVAIGGFGLAVAATVHSVLAASPDRRLHLFALALVVWPVAVALPAYLVALAASRARPTSARRSWLTMHVIHQICAPFHSARRHLQSILLVKKIARPVGILKRNVDVAFIVNLKLIVSPSHSFRPCTIVIKRPLYEKPISHVVRMNLKFYSGVELESWRARVYIGQFCGDSVAATLG